MVTDLAEVRRLGEAKDAENLEFRRYLSAHHHHDIEPFRILADRVQRSIDCRSCANCCRYLMVTLTHADIGKIADHLGIPPETVAQHYTEPDPDAPAGRILQTRDHDCIFLNGTLCTVYRARPRACRDFPHVAPGTHSLGGRMESICRRASVCPIVFNALEQYKHQVGYRPAVVPR